MTTAARVGAILLIAALAIIAVVAGIDGMVRGPKAQAAGAQVESNFRFLSAFLLAGGVVLGWCLFRFDQAAIPLRVVCATVFIGGFARLLAIPVAGGPSGTYVAFIVAEIVGSATIAALHAIATAPAQSAVP